MNFLLFIETFSYNSLENESISTNEKFILIYEKKYFLFS